MRASAGPVSGPRAGPSIFRTGHNSRRPPVWGRRPTQPSMWARSVGLADAHRFVAAEGGRNRLLVGRAAELVADVLAQLGTRLGGQEQGDPGADQQADAEDSQRPGQVSARRLLALEADEPEHVVLVQIP